MWQLNRVLFHPVLHRGRSVAQLPQMPVDLPDHGLAPVTYLLRAGEERHQHVTVERLKPRSAVRVPEHFGPNLPGRSPATIRDSVDERSAVRDHRFLARAIARKEQAARGAFGKILFKNVPQLRP